MKLIHGPEQLQVMLQKERVRGKSIGFVPTMGALHEGHLALTRAAKHENDRVVASIFVNPTQFGPREDFKKYPRTLVADKRKLQRAGVDYLFYPSVQAMYPEGLRKRGQDEYFIKCKKTSLSPFCERAKWPRLAKGLCGKFRPGHFQGVVTVVEKLLNIVGPCRLYLGAKDYQQTVVIRRLVSDLAMSVTVRVMPTVREKDGLAMSSRNRYLNFAERRRARAISQTLFKLRKEILKRKGSLAAFRAQAVRKLKKNVDQMQYFEIVDPETLRPLRKIQGKMVALTACFVGETRLIDNVIISLPSTKRQSAF